MHCPFCQASDTKVIDSRLSTEGVQVRRRRECIQCAARFTTYEVAELTFPRVIKRDNRSEAFSEPKLRAGMLRALQKCAVRLDDLESSIQRIVNQARGIGGELTTELLGAWVMEELKALDQVAYLRFASVYRRFADLEAFQAEITSLHNKDKI